MKFNLRRNTALALFETGVTILALLALYRIMLTHLQLSDLGIWSLVAATASAARLGDLGVAAGVNRFVALADLHQPDRKLVPLIHTATLATAGLYSVLALMTFWPAWTLLRHAATGLDLDAARALLPYALTSLVIVNVWGVVSSCLAGLQRSYLKSSVAICGSFILLVSSALLLPSMGLKGVAVAQIIQSAFLLIAGWWCLSKHTSKLGLLPTRFDWHELKPLIRYSTQIQLGTIAGFLFEPATKIVMARFGGLDALGIYEVASRLVTQTRSLIVSANQTLVSAFTSLNETNKGKLFNLFDRSFAVTSFGILVLVGGLNAAAPLAARILLGEADPQFQIFVLILCCGWGINTLLTPVYMLGLGTGVVRYNLYSHLCIAATSPIFAILMGGWGDAVGVSIGTMLGLACGTGILIVGYINTFRPMRAAHNNSDRQGSTNTYRST